MFEDLSQLESWLRSIGVDSSRWGRDCAKTAPDLWKEIRDGESSIRQDPPRRIVRGVARLIIKRDGNILIEVQQQLRDGRIRPRKLPPSEKMKQDEAWLEAAWSCVTEELRPYSKAAQVFEKTHVQRSKVEQSKSYPGLITKYTFHDVDTNVPNLPTDDFTTPETGKDDAVAIHYWSWWPEAMVLPLL